MNDIILKEKKAIIVRIINLIILAILIFNFNLQFINHDYMKIQDREYYLEEPSNLAIDDNDLIYVFDNSNGVVQVYNTNGDFQWSFAIPIGMNGRGYLFNKENELYVISKRDVVYKYKDKQFIGKEEIDTKEIINLTENLPKSVYDSQGNRYEIGDFFNTIEKTTPQNNKSVIVKMDIIPWIFYYPLSQMAIMFIVVFGLGTLVIKVIDKKKPQSRKDKEEGSLRL